MKFLDGATSLDSISKAYETSEAKKFFPYEWFDHADKTQKARLPPYDEFYSTLRSCTPFETENMEYVFFFKRGMTTEQAVADLKLSMTPPTRVEIYQSLRNLWRQEHMSSFKDFLRWRYKKDVVPTLKTKQKIIFYTRIETLAC